MRKKHSLETVRQDTSHQLLDLSDVINMSRYSEATIYRAMNCADPKLRLAKPFKIGRFNRWEKRQVDDWCERIRLHGGALKSWDRQQSPELSGPNLRDQPSASPNA